MIENKIEIAQMHLDVWCECRGVVDRIHINVYLKNRRHRIIESTHDL